MYDQVRLATSRHWRTLSVKSQLTLRTGRHRLSLVSPSQSGKTEDLTVDDQEEEEEEEEKM